MNQTKRELSRELSVAGLLLNLLVLPGVGTILCGRRRDGWYQILVIVAAILLGATLAFSGFRLGGVLVLVLGCVISWIWALVTSIVILYSSYGN